MRLDTTLTRGEKESANLDSRSQVFLTPATLLQGMAGQQAMPKPAAAAAGRGIDAGKFGDLMQSVPERLSSSIHATFRYQWFYRLGGVHDRPRIGVSLTFCGGESQELLTFVVEI